MILRDKQDFTVLHLFSGSGGGALGFKRVGFHSLGSIDLDPIACRDLERLTGERAICADILAMGPADLPARRRELACLQSFPDDFMFEGSDSSSKTQRASASTSATRSRRWRRRLSRSSAWPR